VPKKEVDYIYDLDDQTLSALWLFSKKVAKGVEAVVPCNRIGISVIGLEVPHAHVHLLPINTLDDINFSRPRVKLAADEFVGLAAQIALHIKL
jgi:histidine triad (HIT) family protein